LWRQAFPDHSVDGIDPAPYEALRYSSINDLDAELRHRLTRTDRVLTDVTCQGRHHNQPVQCRYRRPARRSANQ